MRLIDQLFEAGKLSLPRKHQYEGKIGMYNEDGTISYRKVNVEESHVHRWKYWKTVAVAITDDTKVTFGLDRCSTCMAIEAYATYTDDEPITGNAISFEQLQAIIRGDTK